MIECYSENKFDKCSTVIHNFGQWLLIRGTLTKSDNLLQNLDTERYNPPMEKIKPILAIYNATQETTINNVNQNLFKACVFTHNTFDEKLCGEIISQINTVAPVVIIDAQAIFPKFWYERLSQPFEQNEGASVCTALTTHVNNLSPLASGDVFEGNVQKLDQIIYLLQSPDTIYSKQLNTACFMVQNKSILHKLKESPILACNNLMVQTHVDDTIQLTDIIDTGDQNPLPAHALAALQWKLKKHLKPVPNNNSYPILDNKPIILHVCMGWGGGVHQWINDYCHHEKTHQHLILSSQGELYRKSHGESLTLNFANTSGFEMRKYDLQTPIDATCLQHDEYQSLLSTIIEQFQVKQIMVSSLIGHSMQCLQTGLPTIRVFHDYFPSWPSLIADLEDETITCSNIQKALLQTKKEPFGLISEQLYKKWQQCLHKIYQNKEIKLVAPSQSVVDNLIKIDHSAFKNISIIPHAINPLKPLTYQNSITSFQVLVLGRINPPKGQQLLEDIIAELGEKYIFMLIGAGNEGKKYFKIKNIGVEMEYDNAELQKLLEETSPDLALITSQTSETFNYTLSELQQAGICTISTKFGALKERIVDGITGFLCDNNYLTIANKIRELQKNPKKILAVRENLKQIKHLTFADEISQYQELLKAKSNSQYKLISANKEKNVWAQELHFTHKIKLELSHLLEQTQSTLAERTQWGQKLTKQLKKAADDIDLERKESHYLKKTLKQETTRMNEEIEGLHKDFEISQKKAKIAEKEKQSLLAELTSLYNSRSWRVTKPMRLLTTWARHKRNAIRFRISQIKTFPSRAIRSFKTRGLKGTASVIKGKINKSQLHHHKEPVIELTQNYKPLSIKIVKKPSVSIIIPVFNHYEHTYNCLKSIAQLQDKTSFEIIVVDDCSTDNTQELINDITGITYKKQPENGGFIESCNTGAQLATGQYLMFLNNDTVVYDKWLDSLIEVFHKYPDAGLVGSKLVYPNNQLQEAGGIIFSDASGWNYGRMSNPDEPWYNHVRTVDYCSGASILIESSVFKQVGYFDERYKPAYYEDVDLAFLIRELGKKVYYQPASKITHFEGISSGTDLTQGMKKYQVVNQDKFKKKWANQLTNQPKPGTDIELSRIHSQPKRILVFDACTPTPDQDAGSLRMINIIKILKELNFHVVFIPENLGFLEKYTIELQQLSIECIYVPTINNPVKYLKDKGKYFQHVILSRHYVAEPVMPFIREYCPNAQIIFDTVDLHYLREQRMAEVTKDKQLLQSAGVTKKKELSIMNQSDTTLVVSPYEVEVLSTELPAANIQVLSTIHTLYGCRKPYAMRKDIMFVGSYQHTPNVDAVQWFVQSVFPLIEKKLPELVFHIIGSKAPKHIKQLARENIVFHGFVEDIEPFMDEIRIAVAPLRYGAGVKGKINSSMSYGQPVVGTKIAVEGMFTQEGVDVLTAETPQQFADQILRLYNDEDLWNTLSKGGLENVQKHFSFDAAKQAIKQILD